GHFVPVRRRSQKTLARASSGAGNVESSSPSGYKEAATDPPQTPLPGFGDNKSALSGLPSQSFASGGGWAFAVMFGQTRAYLALMASHFSSPGSVSALIASTGHSGSQTPQSMHSSGWMTSMFSPS